MQVIEITVTVLPDGRMDTKNAAAYLGFAVKTLTMMRCYGTGPKFVKRGRIFYFRADLDAWIKEGRARITGEARPARARAGSGKR